MKRFDCLKLLASMIDAKTIVVANVGPISREWNALRPSDANLLQVNLGLCAAVGLGISVSLPQRQVVILDGDGNLLLNLASLADMANQDLKNTVHIVLDNEAYEGGGGLRSATGDKADLSVIARGAGVPQTCVVTTLEEFATEARQSLNQSGHRFIVAKVAKGSVANLPTITLDGKEGKYRFARYIERTEGVEILRPRYTHIKIAAKVQTVQAVQTAQPAAAKLDSRLPADSGYPSSRYNPKALSIGSSCMEKRIASSVDERLACSCHDQRGTTNESPLSQLNDSPLMIVVPLPRKAW